MNETDTHLELIELLDFELEIPCDAGTCGKISEWAVTWSCGHVLSYCTDHKRFFEDMDSEGQMKCDIGGHKVPKGENHIVREERLK